MNRHYFLWIVLITLICAFVVFYSMWETIKPPAPPPPVLPHPIVPFKSYISGVGIVEASSDNIFIGTPVNRIVEKVFVHTGQEVKKGDILFKLEDQDLLADLASRQVEYEIAKAKLQKMKELPRREDIIAAEAALQIAQVELEQAKNQYEMVQGLQDLRALSQQDINRRRFNYEQAQARWREAQANLNKVKAGTWKPDLEIASLEVQQAKTNIDRVKADIQRTIIRSPIDGKVLQIKIHAGESPATIGANGPLMIVGNINEFYLKVSINQFDAPYFRPEAPAVAYLRGNMRIEFPLEFVRLVPYLVNKQNLTNDITEQVDTRVLQVIYLIKAQDHHIFVGQQMDVFIEAEFPS
jgi:HlyD family secretion protein